MRLGPAFAVLLFMLSAPPATARSQNGSLAARIGLGAGGTDTAAASLVGDPDPSTSVVLRLLLQGLSDRRIYDLTSGAYGPVRAVGYPARGGAQDHLGAWNPPGGAGIEAGRRVSLDVVFGTTANIERRRQFGIAASTHDSEGVCS